MTNGRFEYRKVPKHWKWVTLSRYWEAVPIIGQEVGSPPYLHLTKNGILLISKGYAWDGASGPAWDTKSCIRGSCIHDALYQLLRLGLLPMEHKSAADLVYRRDCLEDGMHPSRAWWHWKAVDRYGHRALGA